MDKTTRIMNRRHSTVIKPYCHLNNLQNEQRMIVCVVLPFWELPRCDCESWRATSRMSVRANTCCEQIKPVVSQVTVMWLWVLFVVLSSSVSRRGKVNNGGYVVTGSRCALHINRPETLTASFWSDVNEHLSQHDGFCICIVSLSKERLRHFYSWPKCVLSITYSKLHQTHNLLNLFLIDCFRFKYKWCLL